MVATSLQLLPAGPRRVLGRVGACIYCDSSEGLTDEHVVPLALGGADILEAASCPACARATSAVEIHIARSPALWPLRRALGLRSRRKRMQPSSFAAREVIGDQKHEVSIPVESFPLAVPFFVFDRPTFLNATAPPASTIGRVELWFPRPMTNSTALEIEMNLSAHDVARMVAKVGLGYAIGSLGRAALGDVFVRDLILGRTERGNEFVGTLDPPPRLDGSRLHAHAVRTNDEGIVTVDVQLFRPPHAHKPTPVYQIVVGRLR